MTQVVKPQEGERLRSPSSFRRFAGLVTIACLSGLVAYSAFADSGAQGRASNSCLIAANQLGASYRIEQRSPQGERARYELRLWRLGNNQLFIERPDLELAELLERSPRGAVRMVRYFDQVQHAIEYVPEELSKAAADWQSRRNLVSTQMRDQMILRRTTGKGCDRKERYTFRDAGTRTHMDWLPEQQLVSKFTSRSPSGTVWWKLVSVAENADAGMAALLLRESYRVTDFADVADNESDPFLLKLPHNGFPLNTVHSIAGEP